MEVISLMDKYLRPKSEDPRSSLTKLIFISFCGSFFFEKFLVKKGSCYMCAHARNFRKSYFRGNMENTKWEFTADLAHFVQILANPCYLDQLSLPFALKL